MIIDILANTNPMNLTGIASNINGAVKTFPQAVEAEFCAPSNCEYIEYALYDSVSTDVWKNDKSSFLVRRGAATETWTFKLYKAGNYLATISSAALGEYYDFGDSKFLTYTDLKGMVIYWKLVAAAHGNGDYQVVIEKTFAGVTSQTTSHYYRVMPYSFEVANGSVRIESYNNGTFVGTGYTLRGVNWYQSMRVNGRFWKPQPRVTTTDYLDSNRQKTQSWDLIETTYSMELVLLPNFISNVILYDQIIANKLYITDYNVNNAVYRNYPVRIKEISNSEYYTINTLGNFELQFTDVAQGTIKGY